MTRLPWLALFVLGCVAEFFATWAKEHATEKLKGKADS